MRSQVRRVLYSRLFAAILVASIVTGAGSVLVGAILFRGYMDRAIEGWRAEALGRIGIFELMMKELLGKATATGEKALPCSRSAIRTEAQLRPPAWRA